LVVAVDNWTVSDPRWPANWQADAREALSRYIDTTWQVDLWVDPPHAIHGTRYAGYVYTSKTGELEMIHDWSGRPGIYPWKLPRGPLLRLKVREGKGKRWQVAYAHPNWNPPGGLP
jgi:hypothetical protein